MPIIAGMKLTPPMSSKLPKVKRGWPATSSMPMKATNRPKISDSTPLSADPVDTMAAQERPSSASQKYSTEEKLVAKRASSGAANISSSTPITPPISADPSDRPSPRSGRPARVMAKASST